MSPVSIAFVVGLLLGLPFWVLVLAGLILSKRGRRRGDNCFTWPKLPRID